MAKKQKSNNGANLGFEAKLFLAADKLRGKDGLSEDEVNFYEALSENDSAAG